MAVYFTLLDCVFFKALRSVWCNYDRARCMAVVGYPTVAQPRLSLGILPVMSYLLFWMFNAFLY